MSGRAMKSQLALPTGIKKLTNIAVVRLKKHGVRFEIACYKNTVVAWRDKHEKDVDNVLQTTRVYNNVSKGVFAKEDDLLKAFGTTDEAAVCALILETGELQVSDKERKHTFDNILRDAVTVLVDKCVNPETNRPYPPGMIERALKDIHFSVDPLKSAKQQALAALPKLQKVFPIQRAAMRFKFTVPALHAAATLEMLQGVNATVESNVEIEESGAESGVSNEVVCTSDPSVYRTCDKFIREQTGGLGRLEVVTMAVMEGGTSAATFEYGGGGGGGGGRSTLMGMDGFVNSGGGATIAAAFGVFDLGDSSGENGNGGGGERPLRPTESATREPRLRGAGPGTSVRHRRDDPAADVSAAGEGTAVLYPRGAIAALPEAFASRRDRFTPLDAIQPGWQVELRQKQGSSVVDAVFFCPVGVGYKAFADARREALKDSKGR
eukprot:CAMPEP_0181358910 /NCGR_PEP_ID=MMETSP1106-20121128/5785_1 /TAXON_ID=81844 /ORGANISM="Mantoniella antarctica, Strain SL-175" /LENGTH=436 /DNA_ID=CAMNT_0023471949 /DNA_START=202 /DNA_END=1512 /DNA_ORIENTATION=+